MLFIYPVQVMAKTTHLGAGCRSCTDPFLLPCLGQGVSVVAVSLQHETNLSFTLKMVLVLFFSLQRLLMHCTLNSH